MAETVIITGRDIEVDHQTEGQPDPKRRRPDVYNPPTTDVDVLALFSMAAHTNPYWSDEANDYADTHPNERPVDIARRFQLHRIETK